MEMTEEVRRGPGRPRKNPIEMPMATREPTIEPTRQATRDKVVYGRDGEVLSRRQSGFSDPYVLPPELMDKDWDYQWNAVAVVGNTEVVVHMESMHHMNGWRPVPADRPGFKERFGQAGKNGNCIIIGSQMLVERPKQLTNEARKEEYRTAVEQIRDREAAMMGGKAALKQQLARSGMGEVDVSGYKGRRTNVQIDIDPEASQVAPKYEYGEE